MTVTVATVDGYNARRYGTPWAAKIEDGKYNFIRGAYHGNESGGEIAIEDPEIGQIYAVGQKDQRGSGANTVNMRLRWNGKAFEAIDRDGNPCDYSLQEHNGNVYLAEAPSEASEEEEPEEVAETVATEPENANAPRTRFAGYRERAGLSIRELSMLSGVSLSQVARIDSGERDIANMGALAVAKLAAVLHVSVEELVGFEQERQDGCTTYQEQKLLDTLAWGISDCDPRDHEARIQMLLDPLAETGETVYLVHSLVYGGTVVIPVNLHKGSVRENVHAAVQGGTWRIDYPQYEDGDYFEDPTSEEPVIISAAVQKATDTIVARTVLSDLCKALGIPDHVTLTSGDLP